MASRKMLILKFGGTSMGSASSIQSVMEIIRMKAKSEKHVITVVSAMAGVTDALLEVGHESLRGRTKQAASRLEQLSDLHLAAFRQLTALPESHRWMQRFIGRQMEEIERITQGIALLKELSDRTLDRLLGYGEVLSSRLLARVLRDSNPCFCHSDARDWLCAERTRQGPVVDFEATGSRAKRYLAPLLRKGLHPIIPGFICRDSTGAEATLGRNGSDYSASIVGAVLRAREIWIYTDVDGIMTADPNLVAEANVLSQISYQEAAEMSHFGAKVLHPKTMIPAILHSIPIRIRNTFNPEAPGTLITSAGVKKPVVKTVTSVRNLALINVQGNGMVGIPGFSSRLFDTLAHEGINVMMISQSSSEHSICIVIRAGDSDLAIKALSVEFQREIDRDLIEGIDLTKNIAIISIIGAGMRGAPGISGKLFEALGKCHINVLAIAQGSSELNISAVISERDVRHAVQAIHTTFGLTQDLNIFVFGCGNIGRTLLRQVFENRQQIAQTLQVNLKVLGVSNSKNLLFSDKGISGEQLQKLGSGESIERVPGCETRPSTDDIFDRISMAYKSDVVLVDATAAEFTSIHIEGLKRGFHIVTANKKPLTSGLNHYRRIRNLRRRRGLNYQYEATFGAGLPLLSTLQDLINTGDRILRIQGCLSGTLGFICSRLDEGEPLSRAVAEAMALGYTEPDPRDDLSGLDVARKALIIAREMGIALEISDIRLEAMIARRFFKLPNVATFLSELPAVDGEMRGRIESAKSKNRVLRYIADISPEACCVGLQEVTKDSPIGRLRGPDNILVFQTSRYLNNPLVIQGPGAGAGVTAAGVLSDMLKIAKWI